MKSISGYVGFRLRLAIELGRSSISVKEMVEKTGCRKDFKFNNSLPLKPMTAEFHGRQDAPQNPQINLAFQSTICWKNPRSIFYLSHWKTLWILKKR